MTALTVIETLFPLPGRRVLRFTPAIRVARDVPVGASWAFRDHRSCAALIRDGELPDDLARHGAGSLEILSAHERDAALILGRNGSSRRIGAGSVGHVVSSPRVSGDADRGAFHAAEIGIRSEEFSFREGGHVD